MTEILEMIIEGFFEHWAKVAVGAGLMAVGWFFGWIRARGRWKRKEFFERVNFSLNIVRNNKLQIRTLMEKTIDEVFLNKVAVSRLLNAATKTTAKNPIVPLPKADYWFYLNSALNEISEKFAFGFIRRDSGKDVESHNYTICLTNEFDGAIRTRKIRVMIVRTDLLNKLPDEIPKLESPNHKTRWNTLNFMANRIKSHPHEFLNLELAV